jgi:hypothetical protein
MYRLDLRAGDMLIYLVGQDNKPQDSRVTDRAEQPCPAAVHSCIRQ